MTNVLGFMPKARFDDRTDVFLSELFFKTIASVVLVPNEDDPTVGLLEVPKETLAEAKVSLQKYLVSNGWLPELAQLAQIHFSYIVTMCLTFGSMVQSDLQYDCFASMNTEVGFEPRIEYYFTLHDGNVTYVSIIITPTYLLDHDTSRVDVEGNRTAFVGRPEPKLLSVPFEPDSREAQDVKDLLELFVCIGKLNPGGVEYNPRLIGSERDGYRFDTINEEGNVFMHLNHTISFHESIKTSIA